MTRAHRSCVRAAQLAGSLGVLAIVACNKDAPTGPCYWDARQDRNASVLTTLPTSLECDGTAVDPPFSLSVRYEASSPLLVVNIDAVRFMFQLYFDAALPDGTYTVAPPLNETTNPGPDAGGAPDVTSSGAIATGTFTFIRSRDVPFVDIAKPEVKTYQSTIDLTFDLVATLPHPDPSMGTGCTLVTGEQHATIELSGPVIECAGGGAPPAR